MSIKTFPEYGYNSVVSASTTASSASGSLVDVITLGSITTQGFPVDLLLISGYLSAVNSGGAEVDVEFQFKRDSTLLGSPFRLRNFPAAVASNRLDVPATLRFRDRGLAIGTYVYKLQYRVATGTSVEITSVVMLADEFTHF